MINRTGYYVSYKGVPHIVVADSGSLVKILNPVAGNRKLNVKRSNVTPLKVKPAPIVEHANGHSYIVTPKNNIISLTTGRLMKWTEESGDYKAILAAATTQN